MYELVLISRELRKQMKKEIPADIPIVLGREPKSGWGIPWDPRVSREHFEVRLVDGQLHVKLTGKAKNPMLFKGKTLSQFECDPGDEFRVGRTIVKFVYTDLAVIDEQKPFGNYSIKKTLGSGPAGTSYGAVDNRNKQQAVVKVFSLEGLSEELSEMFAAELKPWVQLKATGSVTVTYDGGLENGRFYIARELVQGSALAKHLEDKGPIPVSRATEMIQQAIRGLADLQQNGLVHGNIKPSNFLIRGEGSVRLADPMLRCVADSLGNQRFVGSPFMAPEQIEYAGAANIVSDIYALGCVWYAMVVGEAPFSHATAGDGTLAMRPAPPDPRARCPKLSDHLFSIMFRMIAHRPDDRYQEPPQILDEFLSSKIAGIRVRCDQCGQDYRLNVKYAGKIVRCKDCRNKIRVREEL
ncbi:MAG: protein kinase [Planctomycetota bacterium]|nr:protein kinase [Planctomycetota bacterium]